MRTVAGVALAAAAAIAIAAPASGEPASGEPAGVIPPETTQLITGVIADWRSTAVTLRRWKRTNGAWVADGDAWQGVIGKAGAAWGRGLHGDGAPRGGVAHRGGKAGRDATKREGDGKAPAGAFALRGSYGYATAPPSGTVLPYTQVTASWQCVDDPASAQYTRIVDRAAGITVDWRSAEAMRRSDELYTWVVDIAHNAAAAPRGGSCIFLHVWRGPKAPTVGCTAMPEPAMAALLAGLDRSAVYVLLPRAEYAALASVWQLPRQPD